MKKREKTKFTSIGGQALIEGIMMRGPVRTATVIRKSDNTFAQKVEKTQGRLNDRYPILKAPLIRGVYAFIDSMVMGIKEINYSAEFFEIETEPDYKPSKFEAFLDEKLGDKLGGLLIVISLILGIALSVGLFIILPTFLIGLTGDFLPTVLKNLLEGVLRLVIFVLYIFLVSKMKDIKRVFMYHGAEHKTIACYENKDELIPENVAKHRRFHPRCGTSFLLIVMVISILVFSFLRWDNVLERSLSRVILMPVVMAISYEIIKLAGRHDNIITRIISAPGMWLQRLTTLEPDISMIEVAIRAINLVRDDLTQKEVEELLIMPLPSKGKDEAPQEESGIGPDASGETKGEAAEDIIENQTPDNALLGQDAYSEIPDTALPGQDAYSEIPDTAKLRQDAS